MDKHNLAKVYVISGLGVDHSVFESIDFGNHEVIPIHWLEPINKETLVAYANRLSAQIKEEYPIIIGLSFGGMLTVEIAKQIKCKQVILISSAASDKELPAYYRPLGKLAFHRLIPSAILFHANVFSYYLFGIQSKSAKKHFRTILQQTNHAFGKWAIDAILHWKNEDIPQNIIRIHGDKDCIIPIHNIKPDYTIAKAGHFMIVEQAREINKILLEILQPKTA